MNAPNALTIYRRHKAQCPHRHKGQGYTACPCPIWVYGTLQGQRIRKAVGLNDWARAIRRIESWEQTPKLAALGSQIQSQVASYLANCRLRGVRDSTLDSYSRTLYALAEFCRVQSIADLSELTLEYLNLFRSNLPGRRVKVHAPGCLMGLKRAGRRKGCMCSYILLPPSLKTQRKVIETLRGFYGFALEYQWVKTNPTKSKSFKPPIDNELPTMPFSREEIAELLRACNQIQNPNEPSAAYARLRAKALVLLLLYSGFRISDAVKLKRADLDLASGRLLVRIMKTRRPLYIHLPPSVTAALSNLPQTSDYFLWSGVSKLATAVGSARRTVACLARMTGIPAHPHRFRDTFSVRLLEQGEDIRTVQQLLGHRSIATTEKHYAPWVLSMQRRLDEATGKLDFESA